MADVFDEVAAPPKDVFDEVDQGLPTIKPSPYEEYKVSHPGPMTQFGPPNPQELLALPQLLKAPADAMEQSGIMSGIGEVAADFLRRTGINPAAQSGVSLAPTREQETYIPSPLEEAFPNVGRGLEETARSFVTPENLALAPFAGLRPVQKAFEAQMAAGIPESAEQAVTAPTTQERTQAAAQAILGGLAAKHLIPKSEEAPPGASVVVQEYPNGFKLSSIDVPKESQGLGVGTKAMRDLISKSDETGKPIFLTASTSNELQPRLNAFYERLGFSHYKDDPLSGKPMYRYDPEVPPSVAAAGASPEAPSVSAAEVPVAAGAEPAKVEPNVTPEVTQEGVPPIIGMGGAASGEIPATGEGADIFGVAERVRAERARAGQTPQLEPGEGVSSADAVAYGKTLLEKDPAVADVAATAFEKDKALTYEGFAAARAKSEDLFAKARQIEEEHGTDSNEYRAAAAEGAKWDKITKDMQTEWHKLGQAQQGQTDLDTGTFTGLEREWIKQTKKPFTPEQAQRARVIAEESSNATEAATRVNVELADKLAKATFTNPASKKIWDYAKANYIDKGTTDFVDVVNNVSTDLGVSPADVRKAFAEPKSARKTLDEVYEKYANRRRMVNAAKQWIQDEQAPGYSKFLSAIPRIWFLKTIAGHGTALHVTHAPSQAVNPFNAAIWWKSFFQQWPFAYKKGYSEMMIQDAVQDPNYIRARRWGLQNDFFKNTGDYQTTASKLKGMWSILAGTKGTDGLKVLRQRIFSSEWNQLPESLKNEDSGRKIANSVNHMTGALTTKKPGSVMSTIFFAPQLEGSRWVYQYADSYKAGEILANWKKATPEEKYWATREVKQKAAIVGTYLGLLTANQGLLKAMGSSQDINFTDPTKSDWLSFKAAGHKVGFMGPMLGETRLLANMLKTGVEAQRKGPDTRSDREKQAVADYARGKLSPFTGNIADATLMQADYSGRPLPWSNDRVPAYLRKRGIGKYTYGEYLSQQLPIPFAEAAREVWEQQGVDKDTADKWFKVLAVGAAATTGARVGTDYSVKGK